MGRRGPSRSLFAALPADLRSVIRTNGYIQAQNGPDLDSLAVKKELLDAGTSSAAGPSSAPKLLRTQPASPTQTISESDDEPEGAVPVNGRDHQPEHNGTAPTRSPIATVQNNLAASADQAIITPARARAVKRRRIESVWQTPEDPYHGSRAQKRRKGKQVEVFNAYEGHPWDCTGLVERYRNWNDVPDDIKKCEHTDFAAS